MEEEKELIKEVEEYKHKLNQLESELSLLYEVSNAMRRTLKLDEILYIILTAVTSHVGLGFNRAMLFLVNENENCLEGKMGIGPGSAEEATLIWKAIDAHKMTLEDLISAYESFLERESQLDSLVKSIKIPLTNYAGPLALSALEGKVIEVTTEEERNRISDVTIQLLKSQYFVTVPLKAKDKIIGVILADNIFTGKPITKNHVKMLTMFANHAGLAIENSRLYEKTLHLSHIDSLTGLWNHGHFQYLLDQYLEIAQEREEPLSLFIIDIDNFKNYNDKLGHPTGDEVLKKIAVILKEGSRKQDKVSRYGGEEFTIILPNTSKDEAKLIAERIRQKVLEHEFINDEIQPLGKLTVSIGVASYPIDAKNKQELILKADKALLKAKKSGKNRTLLYSYQLELENMG
jgi:diguanylate cyclase (GGDEF)-like protein